MNNHSYKRINKISTDYHLKIKQCVDRVSQAHLQHIQHKQAEIIISIHNNSCSSIYSIAIEIVIYISWCGKTNNDEMHSHSPMWSMRKITFQIIMKYFSEKWLAKTAKCSNKNLPNETCLSVCVFHIVSHFIRHFEAKIDNYLVFNHEINECYHCVFNLIYIMTSAIRKIVFTLGAA